MANFVFTSNMRLKSINERTTSWFIEWVYNFTRLDTHDHSTNLGVNISATGVDSTDDFTFGSLTFATAASSYLGMIERATDPSAVSNYGFLYTKDVGGITELFYIDSAGTLSKLSNSAGGVSLLDDGTAYFLNLASNSDATDLTADRTLTFDVNNANRTIDLNENFTIENGYDVAITAEDAATAIVIDNANFEVENTNGTQRDVKITSAKAGNTLLTFEENFSIGDGYDVTITAEDAASSITLDEQTFEVEGEGTATQLFKLVNAENAARTLTFNEDLTVGDGYAITITAEDATTAIVLDNANFEVENTNGTQRDIKITSAKAGNTTLTLEENFSIGDGYDVSITAQDAASSIILDEQTLEIEGEGTATQLTKIINAANSARTLTFTADLTIGAGSTITATAEDAAGALILDNCSLEVEDDVGSGNTIKFVIATDDASRTVTLSENLIIDDGFDLTLSSEDAAGAIVLDNANIEIENTNGTQRDFKITSAKAGNTTLTFEENFSIGDGYDVTITAEDVAGSIVLDEQTFEVEGEGTATRLTKLINAADSARTLSFAVDFTAAAGSAITMTAEDAAGAITLDNCSLEVEDTIGSGNTIKFIIGTDDASRTVTLSENLVVGDGYDVTLTAEDAASSITLDEQSFEVEGEGTASQLFKLVNAENAARTLTFHENLTIGDGAAVTITAEDAAGSIVLDEQTFEVEGEGTATRLTKLINAADSARTLTFTADLTVGAGSAITLTAEDAAGAITLDNCGFEVEDTVGSGNIFKLINATSDASRSITMSENLVIGDGYDITLTATGAAGSVLLTKQTFEVQGEGTATRLMTLINASDAAATLTIDGASGVVDQDVSADASPTFSAITKDSANIQIITTTSGDIDLQSVDKIVRVNAAEATNANTHTILFGDDTGGATGVRNVSGALQYNVGGAGWVALAAAGGANQALDNLAAVAVNTSITSDTDITDDLGTGTKTWREIFAATITAGATTPGWMNNLGLDYDTIVADTLVISDSGGVVLSGTNRGYVTVPSTTAGQLVVLEVSAGGSFIDDGGASDLTNLGWGITETAHLAEDRPFFLYVVNRANSDINGADGNSAFFISANPCLRTTPAAANDIGDTSAIPVNDTQDVILIMDAVTVANYVSLPCQLIGAFRMQWSTTTDDWTVQALSNRDGLGSSALDATFSTVWTMPVNQMGAIQQAGPKDTYLIVAGGDNTTDVPVWATTSYGDYTYTLKANGDVHIIFSTTNEGNCTNGDVAGQLKLSLPYAAHAEQIAYAYTPTGNYQVGGAGFVLLNGVVLAAATELSIYTAAMGAVNANAFSNTADDIAINFTYKAF